MFQSRRPSNAFIHSVYIIVATIMDLDASETFGNKLDGSSLNEMIIKRERNESAALGRMPTKGTAEALCITKSRIATATFHSPNNSKNDEALIGLLDNCGAPF
ncbi:hypothetical protein Trydic_g3142 [Trypoxylus dichotomus]